MINIYRLLAVLFTAELARGAFYISFLPVYAVSKLGYSVTLTGTAISLHYLVETLVKSLVGYQLDRLGSRVLVAALSQGLIALIIIFLLPLPVVIIICSALYGLSMAPVWLEVMKEVAPVDCPERPRRIGWVFSAWLGGAGGGAVGINFFLGAGYRQAFVLILFLWLVALLLAVSAGKHPVQKNYPQAEKSIIAVWQEILSSPLFARWLMPGMFLQTAAAGFLLPLLPVFAREKWHLSSSQYGLLLLMGGAVTVITLNFATRLIPHYPLSYLLGSGFTATSILLALLPNLASLQQVLVVVILLGLAYAVILPAWNTLLARAIPTDQQATGWGVFATLEGPGLASGPALGGSIASLLGIAGSLRVVAVLLLAMAIFYFLAGPKLTNGEKTDEL